MVVMKYIFSSCWEGEYHQADLFPDEIHEDTPKDDGNGAAARALQHIRGYRYFHLSSPRAIFEKKKIINTRNNKEEDIQG